MCVCVGVYEPDCMCQKKVLASLESGGTKDFEPRNMVVGTELENSARGLEKGRNQLRAEDHCG